jgi:hypothetical protein
MGRCLLFSLSSRMSNTPQGWSELLFTLHTGASRKYQRHRRFAYAERPRTSDLGVPCGPAQRRARAAGGSGGRARIDALTPPYPVRIGGRVSTPSKEGSSYGIQVTWYWSVATPLPPQISGLHKPFEQDGRPLVTFGKDGWFS